MINCCPKCGGENIVVQGLETYCLSAVGPDFHTKTLENGTVISLSDKCLYHFNLYEREAYSMYLYHFEVEPKTLPVDQEEFLEQESNQKYEEERLRAKRDIERTRRNNRNSQRTFRNKPENKPKIAKWNSDLYKRNKAEGKIKRKRKSARVLSEQRPLTLGLL